MKVKFAGPVILAMAIALALAATACSDSAGGGPVALATVTYLGPTNPALSSSSEGFASVAYVGQGVCNLVLNEQIESPIVTVTVFQVNSAAFASYTYSSASKTLTIQTFDDDGSAVSYPFSVVVY